MIFTKSGPKGLKCEGVSLCRATAQTPLLKCLLLCLQAAGGRPLIGIVIGFSLSAMVLFGISALTGVCPCTRCGALLAFGSGRCFLCPHRPNPILCPPRAMGPWACCSSSVPSVTEWGLRRCLTASPSPMTPVSNWNQIGNQCNTTAQRTQGEFHHRQRQQRSPSS